MHTTRAIRGAALFGFLVVLAGCQKLEMEKSFTLSFGDIKSFTPDLPNREQRVAVKASSSAVPVTVYIIKQQDEAQVMARLANQQAPNPKDVLASKEGQSVEVEATIPAKTAYVILVTGAKKDTEVKLSIKGK